MENQDKKLIILIVLGVLAALSLMRGIMSSTGSGHSVVESGKPIELAGQQELPLQRQAARTKYDAWDRSPFVLISSVPTTTAEVMLEGIIWDEKQPIVLINGQALRIGDAIGLNTVIDIQKDKVILNDGSKDFELKLEK